MNEEFEFLRRSSHFVRQRPNSLPKESEKLKAQARDYERVASVGAGLGLILAALRIPLGPGLILTSGLAKGIAMELRRQAEEAEEKEKKAAERAEREKKRFENYMEEVRENIRDQVDRFDPKTYFDPPEPNDTWRTA